ncbi:hypothetical protein [Burkholderia sp. BE17]|uniref:hypothetical protein n=1 Tax=Burkholderia sp. BE17 TaxID=2656644 RepID=UPI00128C78D8|nr:hypothetical protein [Burkholderia sp. BE17]MPV66401.1 hypothetical protein [Burkholderia sp. BE17]
MLTRLRALVGGRKPTAAPVNDEPPLELQTVIAGASVYERASNDPEWNGAQRLMVHTARGAFFADKSDAWLQSGWPTMTDVQRARAKAMLKAHIARWQQRQSADAAAAGRGRTNYAKDW